MLDRNEVEPGSPEEMWESLSQRVFEAAEETLGFTKKKKSDWFNENDEEIRQVLEERNRALQIKLSNPTRENHDRLKRARAEVQRRLRNMENQWWIQKAQELQQKADESNSAGFFNALKEVYGPQPKMSDTLIAHDGSSQITEPKQIVARWKEYFERLLNVEAETDESVISELPPYPEQTHMSEPPTIEEVRCAIKRSKSNKSPGIDGIPAEIYKTGGTRLTEQLHQLLLKCWQQKCLPQDFKEVLIIPIYKNKGDHRECGNYRGISLFSVSGKVMAKVLRPLWAGGRISPPFSQVPACRRRQLNGSIWDR